MSYTPPATDPLGWRLVISEDSHGQQKWRYLPEEPQRDAIPQDQVTKYALGLEVGAKKQKKAKNPGEAARNGYEFYKLLQSSDGHFATEYGGPLFLIPGIVIAMTVTGQTFTPEQSIELRRYILNKRRDGGWGLHTAATPTAFGTVMNYVALRLLGMSADEGPMTEIRGLIHKMGGATTVPTWGKVWLSVLGVYEWSGVNPVPPELWSLPDWVPFHPGRWWVHVRAVATPISYLSSVKFVATPTPLTYALRQELYVEPYESINWGKQCNNINPLDVYSAHHPVFDALNVIIRAYESMPSLPFISSCLPIRKHGLNTVYNWIKREDENTGYQTIGPVSKAMNMVVRYHREGADSVAFKKHLGRVDDFFWLGRDGLMMMGTNGSQLWDTAFMAQAAIETGLADSPENKESVLSMLDWLDKCQIRENPKYYVEGYRHRTKGAWPFSTPEQNYTVSDCTAEGLKAVIGIQKLEYTPKAVSLERLRDAVDTLLSMQNPNGGFCSYELQRGSERMEWLNAAEVFGNIMVDYNYVECTTSALSGLKQFTKIDPEYRRAEISETITKAIDWIHSVQRPDGSWYGSWGICFTYATMFALESLAIAGETHENSAAVRRACDFLVSKQMEDGGWGETYMSCVSMEYAQHPQSQVVQTSWAVLALIYGAYPDVEVIKKACGLLMSRQKEDGRWEQEDTEGIFNKNCAIDYPAFKFIFCIWALGKADKYLNQL